ncbi:MAG: hypothetical protein HY005_01780 [Candidatus Staskawiczbacteria bacterium]|nr:hypothetical protein [Candidatus Staskawiczbacteria bacterium]
MSKRKKPKKPEISGVKETSKPARLERHVRVTFFLVANTKEHLRAILNVRNYLKAQDFLSENERELPVTGFTHSSFPGPLPQWLSGETVFIGYWWNTREKVIKNLMIEKTVLFVIDFLAFAEEWKTDENIALLKTRILGYYETFQSPQEEIWIVKQDIYRYA